MPAPRAQRLRSEKYAENINKRGVVVSGKKTAKKSNLGPLVVGFFLFVVVGSAILGVFQSASFGAANTAREEAGNRPRSGGAPRKRRPAGAKKAGGAKKAYGDAKDAPKEPEAKASEAGKAEA